MSVIQCGYNGCKRPIKKGDTACWQHRAGGSTSSPVPAGEALGPEYVEQTRAWIRRLADDPELAAVFYSPGGAWKEGNQAQHSTLIQETPISADALPALDSAIERLADGDDLGVPELAEEAANTRFTSFVHDLRSELGPDRISVLRLHGLHRRTMSGKEQHADEAYHEVIVLDRGTDNEVLVDPLISLYAPVYERERAVDDQLASGETPFGDLPWVGTVHEYTNGSHMWWDHPVWEDGESA